MNTEKKIELMVFDMAGTVVNEDNVVYKTLQEAINAKGYEFDLVTVLKFGAGKEKHQAIKDILKSKNVIDADFSKTVFEDFKNLLKQAYLKLHVSSYRGVEGLIQTVRGQGIKVALNTGYDKLTATNLLNKMNWEKEIHYDVLVTADDVTRGRPNPDMIVKAMTLTGVDDASKVLKAGDSIIDIEEGKNANCGITVGVCTGAHTREQLETANPTYVLDSLTLLREILDI